MARLSKVKMYDEAKELSSKWLAKDPEAGRRINKYVANIGQRKLGVLIAAGHLINKADQEAGAKYVIEVVNAIAG